VRLPKRIVRPRNGYLRLSNAFKTKLLRCVSNFEQWRLSKSSRHRYRPHFNWLLQRISKVFTSLPHTPRMLQTRSRISGPCVEQDTFMNHTERIPSPGVPVNPKLPLHDKSPDTSLWLLQVNAAFEAYYHTPADHHLRWLVLALRGQAMRYWFFCETARSSDICCSIPPTPRSKLPPSTTTQRFSFATWWLLVVFRPFSRNFQATTSSIS